MSQSLVDQATRDALLPILRDEQIGATVASAQAATAQTAEEREKWGVLAALEQATARRIRAALDVPATDGDGSADITGEVAEHLATIRSRCWMENMTMMLKPFQEAVEHVRSVAAALPVELAPLGNWIVRHEEAWVAFVLAEAAGHANSLDAAMLLLAEDTALTDGED